MKKYFVVSILLLFVAASYGQAVRTDFDLSGFGVKIAPDKRLVVVRAALELAGLQTEVSPEAAEFRRRVLEDFKDVDPVIKSRLEVFVQQYRKRHPELSKAETVSPFVSMAYSLGPAPLLTEPERSIDLPDSLLEVLDFSPLVREFYSKPGVAQKIDSYFEEHKTKTSSLEPSAREMVRDILDYLHTRPRLSYFERVKVEVTEGKKKLSKYEPVERFRSFTIVPDFLAGKGNINFLNIGDDYFAVISPQTEISSSPVRRAYLQFVLDPLVLREAREIRLKDLAIGDLVKATRKNSSVSANDAVLVVSRSLVAAADIREEQYRKGQLATDQARRKIVLVKGDGAKLEVSSELDRLKKEFADEAALQLSEAYENGAVFAFYFAEKLVGVEQSGFDIAGSIRDWMANLDPKAESKRLEENQAARQRALVARERRKTESATPLVENPLTKKLLEVDSFITAKDFAAADKRLKSLLSEYGENRVETARIYYSLGRMNSIVAENTKDPEEVGVILEKASQYYKEVIRRASRNDLALISSTYFALGRIYEHFDQNEYAIQIYDAALRIGKVTGGAFDEAFEAKKALLEKQNN